MHWSLGRLRLVLWTGLVLVALSGCIPASFAQTPFQRQAGDAASLASAAAVSIEFTQTGKLDNRYAQASILVYREMLAQIPHLGGLRGAPDDGSADALDAAIDDAVSLLADPCLDSGCDWRGDVDALRETSRALEEASS